MQRLINEIVERAKADRQRIVLPEGTEERTLKAANQILTDGVADLILLGNPDEINACATEWGTWKHQQYDTCNASVETSLASKALISSEVALNVTFSIRQFLPSISLSTNL